MEPVDLLGILRRRWLPILLTALVVLGAVAGVTAMQPKLYSSTVDSFVKLDGGSTAVELQAGSSYIQGQMPSLAALAETSAVLEPVAKELGEGYTAAKLADQVKAVSQPRTVIITVEVQDRDPAKAARIADLTTQQLGKAVTQFAGGAGKDVTLAPIAPATVATAPSSPNWPVNLGAGALLGLLTGLALGLIIDFARRSKRVAKRLEPQAVESVAEPTDEPAKTTVTTGEQATVKDATGNETASTTEEAPAKAEDTGSTGATAV